MAKVREPSSQARLTDPAQLKEAMDWLAQQPNTVFIGQGVAVPGNGMSPSFEDVPDNRKIEWPVAEELQLGACLGLSLWGAVPICIFPRYNFLLRAMDQLVNHLDRLPLYGRGYVPGVIIRVAVGRSSPLDPGPQHQDNLNEPLRKMLKTVELLDLSIINVPGAYERAYRRATAMPRRSTIVVEH